uniref:Queuine tRNA-ribosyltransferase subunit qtrtd1 n=1 Tax=Schistocephalus solidus TaxID=70667 RepID=A0A0X3P4J5_SCHSO
MRFSTGVSGAAPRIGLISEVAANFGDFQTPNCLLYTKFGAVPFLTNDIVRQIDGLPRITFASLSFLREKHIVHTSFGKGLAKLSGLREFPVFLFQSDPTDFPVTRAVERSSISIWAVGGRLPVTMPQYAQCVVNALPAAFQLPVDNETSFRDVCAPGKKRCQKSVERTLGYASEIEKLRSSDEVLAGIPMLFSVTGGNDLDQRLRGLAKTDFSKASGVVLDGFFLDCIDESNQPMDRRPHLDCMFEVLPKLCLQLPSHLPRILTNIWQPDEVARAVTCGVDIFDGTLPFRLSRSGLAWLYPGWMPHSAATTTSRQTPFPSWIAFPLDKELLKGSSGSVFNQPLQEGCSCFTCQRHNRGYISHLHSVNEMLAHILLMM